MAYVGIDGYKKQRQRYLLTATGEILAQRFPHTIGALHGKGAACSPAAHDILCGWTGPAAWSRVALLG